jgi:hypothetical protein
MKNNSDENYRDIIPLRRYIRNNIQNKGYVVCFKFYENNYVGNNLEDLKIPMLEGHKDDMHDDANY